MMESILGTLLIIYVVGEIFLLWAVAYSADEALGNTTWQAFIGFFKRPKLWMFGSWVSLLIFLLMDEY